MTDQPNKDGRPEGFDLDHIERMLDHCEANASRVFDLDCDRPVDDSDRIPDRYDAALIARSPITEWERDRFKAQRDRLAEIVRQVQASQKGSIGSIDSHYCAQIRRADVDGALAEIDAETTT